MSSETICVVGCSGFVGSHVAAELLIRGYSVHGTLREAQGKKADWLMSDVAAAASGDNKLTLYSANAFDRASFKPAMENCSGIIVCAGSPAVAPETMDLMAAIAENVTEAALEANIRRAVYTSSTGSTNPPEGEPELKNEVDHWSDPDLQLQQGKYAAVGKTRLDRKVLDKMEASAGAFRVCTINPTMIIGPSYKPEPEGSFVRFAAIIRGERFADKIPNSSLSYIDVRDLASLHVNALENDQASGRYFGVKQSWHWREILQALERVCPGYKMPKPYPEELPVRATQFDLTRQNSLGVNVRGLDEMLEGLVAELKRREMI